MRLFFLILVVIAVVLVPFIGSWLSSSGFGLGGDQFEKRIDEYVSAHPDRIMRSLQTYHEREYRSNAAIHNREIVANNKEELHDMSYPHVGGDLSLPVVVEFSNYMCSHCKKMDEVVKDFIGKEVSIEKPRAVYIFRTLHIPGSEGSERSIKASLAVNELDSSKFLQFHSALLEHDGDYSEEFIISKASEMGLDIEKFKALLISDKVAKMARSSLDLALKLEISGTPAFITGEQIMIGTQTYDTLVSSLGLKNDPSGGN